jgi:hypothetical protein
LSTKPLTCQQIEHDIHLTLDREGSVVGGIEQFQTQREGELVRLNGVVLWVKKEKGGQMVLCWKFKRKSRKKVNENPLEGGPEKGISGVCQGRQSGVW